MTTSKNLLSEAQHQQVGFLVAAVMTSVAIYMRVILAL